MIFIYLLSVILLHPFRLSSSVDNLATWLEEVLRRLCALMREVESPVALVSCARMRALLQKRDRDMAASEQQLLRLLRHV